MSQVRSKLVSDGVGPHQTGRKLCWCSSAGHLTKLPWQECLLWFFFSLLPFLSSSFLISLSSFPSFFLALSVSLSRFLYFSLSFYFDLFLFPLFPLFSLSSLALCLSLYTTDIRVFSDFCNGTAGITSATQRSSGVPSPLPFPDGCQHQVLERTRKEASSAVPTTLWSAQL